MRLFSNTNWNLYRSFAALYEAGNYTKAELMLGISRKNIRENVKTLSEQIGATLFISHRKGATPTSNASALYPIVISALNLIKDGEESLQEFTSESFAIIRMVIPSTILSFVLNDYFESFLKKFPNVKFEFYNRALQSSYELLEQGQIDFVIDFDTTKKAKSLRKINILELNCILIASKDFLAKHAIGTIITKEQLVKIPLVSDHESINELESENDFKVNAILKTATTDPIYQLVKKGFGMGYYYDVLYANLRDEEIVEVSVSDFALPKLRMICGYRKHFLSRASQEFVNGLVIFCENLKKTI